MHRLDVTERLAWLEIEGGCGNPRLVRCPRSEDEMTDARVCFGCKRYASLALHPTGTKIYVVCEPFADGPDAAGMTVVVEGA